MQRNITVIPVIGIMWDKSAFNPVPNVDEVEAVFDAPLEMFLKVCLSKNMFMLDIYSRLLFKIVLCIAGFRMKIEEQRSENGWEINICSIFLIIK